MLCRVRYRVMKRLIGLMMIGLLVLAAGGCLELNEPPTAAFVRSPASGVAPLAVFFDATESQDPDGTVASYEWAFADGGSSVGATTTHTFTDAGMYSVTLTVTDDRGAKAETVRNIIVTADGALPAPGTKVGDLAPDFSLPDVRASDLLSLSDLRGRVVLLEFWRSTCSSCRSSMPAIEILREKFAADGLVVLLVSQDVTAADVRDFLDEQGYDDTMAVFDEGGTIRDVYGVELVPRLFVIDRQGIIRYIDHPVRIRDRHIAPWL